MFVSRILFTAFWAWLPVWSLLMHNFLFGPAEHPVLIALISGFWSTGILIERFTRTKPN